MEPRQQEQKSKIKWIFYAGYLVDFERIYDQIGITQLLGAKVAHAIDPAQPDGGACCIEISSEGLPRPNLQMNDIFRKYMNQEDFFDPEEDPPTNNHLLVINKVIKVDSEGKKLRVLTEGIKNTSLQHILNQKGKIPETEAVKMFAQLVRALEQIAEMQKVLSQLHPSFLMLDLKGDIKLSPVIFLNDEDWRSRAYTCPVSKGTPLSRMLWNAGVILFEMLIGRLPWDGNTIGTDMFPPSITEDQFSELIRESNVSQETQTILKKTLRIGEFDAIDASQLVEDIKQYKNRTLETTSVILFKKSLKVFITIYDD
mgnify:CR=1 FL=1